MQDDVSPRRNDRRMSVVVKDGVGRRASQEPPTITLSLEPDSQRHPAAVRRTSLYPTAVEGGSRPSSSKSGLSQHQSERSVGVVTPTSSHNNFDLNDPNSPFYHHYHHDGYINPQASALLSKFKPFDEQAGERLKKRISKRKKADDDRARQREMEEAKLVDGQLMMDDDEEQLENDPKLAEGKALSKVVVNHFPKHLMGLPIEDVDPRNREYDETFMVISRRFNKAGYIYRFSATPSFFIFKPWNPIRKLAVYAYTHPLFDIIVILTILANSVSLQFHICFQFCLSFTLFICNFKLYMAMNVDEAVPEYTFLAIYTLEALAKALSRGVALSQYSYFRDPWNWLDFLVLVSAYATIIAQFAASGSNIGGSLKGLKALRVFRVLKTVALIPGLKTIIEALIRALKMLGDVLIM